MAHPSLSKPTATKKSEEVRLTWEEAETLRDFWHAISELANSDLVNPKDGVGEVTTLKVVLRSVDNIFCDVIDRQLTELEEGAA